MNCILYSIKKTIYIFFKQKKKKKQEMLQSKHTFHIKTNLVIPDKQTSTLFVVDLIDLNL